MKQISFVYDDFDGEFEAEGVFDEKGNCLGVWSPNDARWRGEYFSGFMEKLGIKIVPATDEMKKNFRKAVEDYWGM